MAGHEHDHHHEHGRDGRGHGGHAHAPKDFGKAFAIGIALNLGFVVVEVVYGLLANSLALVADAGHNLGDVLGLVMAWVATVLARRAPSKTHTYGLRRGTILAALANAVLLLVAVGAILVEGIRRLIEPGDVASVTVMVVAAGGIAVNGVTAWLFASGRKDVRVFLLLRPGVSAIHDLHVWPMSTTENAMTCHCVMLDGHPGDAFLVEVAHDLKERFKIDHATIQIEVHPLSEDYAVGPLRPLGRCPPEPGRTHPADGGSAGCPAAARPPLPSGIGARSSN